MDHGRRCNGEEPSTVSVKWIVNGNQRELTFHPWKNPRFQPEI
jgi:hypothetical protein